MTYFRLSRIHRVRTIAATLILTTLLFFAWSMVAAGATPLQDTDPPPPAHIETTLIPSWFSLSAPTYQNPSPVTTMAQVATVDTWPAPAPLGPPAPNAPSQPHATMDICGSLIPATCNTVVRFDTRDPLVAQPVWNDYNCVNHSIFPANSLVFSETGYTVPLAQELDLSLAVPLVMSDGLTSMNIFAGIFTDCANNACVAGSENHQLTIYRHAIHIDAPAGVYTTVIDSDNMAGFGDMIIACGNPNPGWCASAVSADITCGNYTINSTTEGGPDDITYYDTHYWVPNFAYDGPERVYRITLTQTCIFSFTFHYDGNPALRYNNYMSYFILDNTCDQRNVWGYPLSPNPLLVGETGATTTASEHWMGPGTHYLVVDGMHLPDQGDTFQLDVHCEKPHMVYLPLILRNHPLIPAVTVNPPSGPVGTTFWFTGVNFTPYENVSAWFTEPNGTQYNLPDFTADGQGGFLRGLQLTGDWPTGTYTYYARGDQSQHTASVPFQITASALSEAVEGGRSFYEW